MSDDFDTRKLQEARRWVQPGDHPAVEVYIQEGAAKAESPCRHCGYKAKEHGAIHQIENHQIVCPGDFIVSTAGGHHFPVKYSKMAQVLSEIMQEEEEVILLHEAATRKLPSPEESKSVS